MTRLQPRRPERTRKTFLQGEAASAKHPCTEDSYIHYIPGTSTECTFSFSALTSQLYMFEPADVSPVVCLLFHERFYTNYGVGEPWVFYPNVSFQRKCISVADVYVVHRPKLKGNVELVTKKQTTTRFPYIYLTYSKYSISYMSGLPSHIHGS